MSQVIYKIINVVNNKFYVGSTKHAKARFRQHRKLLRENRHHCKHLQSAWNKYGEDKFSFVVVETVPDNESLSAAEDVWLVANVGTPNCYNSGYSSNAPWRNAPAHLTPSFGKPVPQDRKEKISQGLKAFYAEDYFNHPRVGKTHSEETKAKISASKRANPQRPWLGKERDQATKDKISAAQKGVPKPGRVYTPEGLEKVREAMKRNAKQQAPLPIADVLAKFPDEVRSRYDFSEAVYLGALVRIEGCKCPTHGVFSQYAAQFRKGSGCPQCGAEKRKKKA